MPFRNTARLGTMPQKFTQMSLQIVPGIRFPMVICSNCIDSLHRFKDATICFSLSLLSYFLEMLNSMHREEKQ